MLRALCVIGLVMMAGSVAAAQERPLTIRLGTATPGGGFPVYGDALIAALAETDPAMTIEPHNTRGSAENIPLLEAGQLDLALVAGEPAYEAFEGIGRPATDLKILTAIYANPGLFVVRGDSAIRSINDLKNKPIAFGAKGSGLVILSRYLLDGLGLDQDKDFTAIYLDRAGDGPAMLADGRVAALWGAGIGWPGFKFASDAPGGARFIAPDANEIARIRARHPFLRPMTVPAGSYTGQGTQIDSVGSWSFVLTRSDLPADVAYRLARALHASEAALGKRLAQARETTSANTIAAAPRASLIHPGVLTYFREIGMVK